MFAKQEMEPSGRTRRYLEPVSSNVNTYHGNESKAYATEAEVYANSMTCVFL